MSSSEVLKELEDNADRYMNKVDVKLSRTAYEHIVDLLRKDSSNSDNQSYGAYTVVSYEGENQEYLNKVGRK